MNFFWCIQMRSEALELSRALTSPLKDLFGVYVWHTGNEQLHKVEEIHLSCKHYVDQIQVKTEYRVSWSVDNQLTQHTVMESDLNFTRTTLELLYYQLCKITVLLLLLLFIYLVSSNWNDRRIKSRILWSIAFLFFPLALPLKWKLFSLSFDSHATSEQNTENQKLPVLFPLMTVWTCFHEIFPDTSLIPPSSMKLYASIYSRMYTLLNKWANNKIKNIFKRNRYWQYHISENSLRGNLVPRFKASIEDPKYWT